MDVSAGARGASSRPRPRPRPGPSLPAPDKQLAKAGGAAGSAIVTAARVGRLLGRSGWRIARQLPGVSVVEHQAERIRRTASHELWRLLDVPQQLFGTASPEEQRVMMLLQDADSDPAPLRSAMGELLQRSSQATGPKSRDYLFGTIVSQLVPDEARILAALADGRRYASVDVVAKQVGRSHNRTVLSNASTVGQAAGVSLIRTTATYLARLQGFGLLDFGTESNDLADQYEQLAADEAVSDARAHVEKARRGSAKIVRKTVSLSELGREFWSACAPAG